MAVLMTCPQPLHSMLQNSNNACRFPAPEVREVIRAVFKDRLTAVEVKGESKTDSKIEAPKYSSDMAKDLADNIRNRLKGMLPSSFG